MTIQAVIFDADGVLLETAYFSDELERSYGLPRSATLDFFTVALEACLLGRADLKQTLAPFLAGWNWAASTEDFLDRWFAHGDRVDRRLVAAIGELRRRGLRCCLATNQEHYRVAYMRQVMGFDQLFDEIFFSAAIGCKKTDAAFYRHVMQKLKLSGSQILFWDDTPANVAAARSQGWHAEHYRSFEEFQPMLAAYLEHTARGANT
jgi:putative hydrolase of the HAD superfamily